MQAQREREREGEAHGERRPMRTMHGKNHLVTNGHKREREREREREESRFRGFGSFHIRE